MILLTHKSCKEIVIDDECYPKILAHHSSPIFYLVDGAVVLHSKILGRGVPLARIILGSPRWNGKYADHIDRDIFNNKLVNLRWLSPSESAVNRKKYSNTSSVFRGVQWRKDNSLWKVKLKKFGKDYYGGQFESEIEAAKASDVLAIKLHGSLAILNFN